MSGARSQSCSLGVRLRLNFELWLLCRYLTLLSGRCQMAAVLGARGTLPGYFTGAESRVDPAVISFEKELDYFTALIKRAGKKPATAESRQKVYVLSLQITLDLCS